AALLELTLLHMIADVDHVEARLSRGQFDDCLLALLLFRGLFRVDLDTGQILEFLLISLQRFTTRALDQINLDGGAGVFLPIDGGISRPYASEARCAHPSRSSQKLPPCRLQQIKTQCGALPDIF